MALFQATFSPDDQAIANVDIGTVEIGVAADKIVLGLGELTGNIWNQRDK